MTNNNFASSRKKGSAVFKIPSLPTIARVLAGDDDIESNMDQNQTWNQDQTLDQTIEQIPVQNEISTPNRNRSQSVNRSHNRSQSQTPSHCPMSEGYLVLEVIDDGAGISKENQKRLFNDIVQFNPEILQAGGGSGLGLWITKGIVDLHNGKIDVFSEGEGKGSKFTVKIPMLRRPSIAGPKHVPKKRSPSFSVERCLMNRKAKSDHFSCELLQPPIATALAKTPEVSDYVPSRTVSDCHSYELLVVDDSRLNRKMLCKILRGAGHICDEAEDGLLAVDKVKERMAGTDITKRTYDAILMDFVMPNMDGPTATREIIALGYQAPIFGVTGNALGSDVEYFISCGARKIFTKPLDLAEFQLHMQIFLSGDD